MDKTIKVVPAISPEKTRETLIREALRLFGDKGFDGTSTREIAAAAGTNVASIAYHFGGKSGLHRACGEAVAKMLANASGQTDASPDDVPITPEALRERISDLLKRMSAFLFLSPQSDLAVPFILREMAHPGEAFEAIYNGMMEPVHKRLCVLWAGATGGDPDGNEVKLTVFSMIGQLLYFRIGARAVARRLGRETLSEQDITSIGNVIEANISARLDAAAKGDS